jgi:hypothetical protein
VFLRLPDAEHGTLRVGTNGHPAMLHHVERSHLHFTAVFLDLFGHCIRVFNGDVEHPVRRNTLLPHLRR